jgi:L-threonylcarbamoyladenylate synthase
MPDPIGDAARWLAAGGLVAYPTETVWGLGADARSGEATARLRRWKGRATDDPVAVLVQSAAAARAQGFELGRAAARLAEAFWPGPLTLVVPSRLSLAPGVARADGAVGLRCSSHPLVGALLRRLSRQGAPLVTATSLNRSGEPAAARAQQARALCGPGPDEPHLLDVPGAETGGDLASTVVDCCGGEPRVLRAGAIGEEELAPLLREIARS